MATLDSFTRSVEVLTLGAVDDPVIAVVVASILAAPLAILILSTAFRQIAVVSTEQAVGLMTLLGGAAALGNFYAGNRLSGIDRKLNAAEILVPVGILMMTVLLGLHFMLPPSPFNTGLRALIANSPFGAGVAG